MIDLIYRMLRPRKAIDEAKMLQTLLNDQHNAIVRAQMYSKKLEALEGKGKPDEIDRATDDYLKFF